MKKMDKLVIAFTMFWLAIPFMISSDEQLARNLGNQTVLLLFTSLPYFIYRINQSRKKKQQRRIPI